MSFYACPECGGEVTKMTRDHRVFNQPWVEPCGHIVAADVYRDDAGEYRMTLRRHPSLSGFRSHDTA